MNRVIFHVLVLVLVNVLVSNFLKLQIPHTVSVIFPALMARLQQ